MTGPWVFLVFALGAAVAAAASVATWFFARRGAPRNEALLKAAIPFCVYAAVAVPLVSVGFSAYEADDSVWDAARLVPSVAWVRGHQVYSSPVEGALQTTMYPPMWVAAYSPVALAETPSAALRMGKGLSLLFSFLPVLLLFLTVCPSRPLALLGAASFVSASYYLSSLGYSLFRPHSDAPSLGFAMLAICILLRPGTLTTRRMAAIAALVWLSVLSKQVMVPILVAVPVWVALVYDRKRAARQVGWLIGVGAVALGAIPLFFSSAGVFFNTVTIPSRFPWGGGAGQLFGYPKPLLAASAAVELVFHVMPLLVVLIASGAILWVMQGGAGQDRFRIQPFLTSNPWSLPLAFALALLPLAVMSRAKIGGHVNSFSTVSYFLLVASVLATIWVSMRLRVNASKPTHAVGTSVIGIIALLLAVGGVAEAQRLIVGGIPAERHRSQVAYEYLIQEDSLAFFPAHPLAHLLADGSLYHLSMSLFDRESMAELPISETQRSAHLPKEPGAVCWDAGWGREYVQEHYFVEYVRPLDETSLSTEWECYSQ